VLAGVPAIRVEGKALKSDNLSEVGLFGDCQDHLPADKETFGCAKVYPSLLFTPLKVTAI
jgi:hypothetical protein